MAPRMISNPPEPPRVGALYLIPGIRDSQLDLPSHRITSPSDTSVDGGPSLAIYRRTPYSTPSQSLSARRLFSYGHRFRVSFRLHHLMPSCCRGELGILLHHVQRVSSTEALPAIGPTIDRRRVPTMPLCHVLLNSGMTSAATERLIEFDQSGLVDCTFVVGLGSNA